MEFWFKIQGVNPVTEIDINNWQIFEKVFHADSQNSENKEADWARYLSEYYRSLHEEGSVRVQFNKGQILKGVSTDPKLITVLKLLRIPGSDKELIKESINKIITEPTSTSKKQYHWPYDHRVKAYNITAWTLLHPLLIFNNIPDNLEFLLIRDILKLYDISWAIWGVPDPLCFPLK
jgi:hypothetical protein